MRAWPNTQNHCKVLRFRTRNSHHLPRIITTRPPFSPNRMRKRCKGCHFARATERHRTEMTKMRQGPPPGSSGHPSPRAPGHPAPPGHPLYVSFSLRFQEHVSNQPQTHAAPGGRRTSPACGSCRRPLKRNKDQGIEKTLRSPEKTVKGRKPEGAESRNARAKSSVSPA